MLSLPFALAAVSHCRLSPRRAIWPAWSWCCRGGRARRVADRQLVAFKRDPASRGRTCRAACGAIRAIPTISSSGSCGAASACSAGGPWGWLGLVAPLLILYSILFVTGIPPTEAQALASRGEDYRRYQRTTSPFVPWPPQATEDTDPRRTLMWYQGILDRDLVPDWVIRRAIRQRCRRRLARKSGRRAGRMPQAAFVAELKASPDRPAHRRRQRAALRGAARVLQRGAGPPPASTAAATGPRGSTTLAESEERMLALTCRAGRPGRRPADPGPGLRLGLACRSTWPSAFPAARITGRLQQRDLRASSSERRPQTRGLANLEVDDRRHEHFDPDERLRPRGLGRDVRAHEELRRAAAAHRRLAEARTARSSSTSSSTASWPTTTRPKGRTTGWPATSSPAAPCPRTTC